MDCEIEFLSQVISQDCMILFSKNFQQPLTKGMSDLEMSLMNRYFLSPLRKPYQLRRHQTLTTRVFQIIQIRLELKLELLSLLKIRQN